MYKKTQTYTDYNDKERTDDFYFYINEAEYFEMETSVEGGLAATLKKITESNDIHGMVNFLKDLLIKSYGIKTEDGRFIKKPELVEEFTQTAAYPAIYMELATDAALATDFINHVFPSKLLEKAEKAKVENLTAGNTPSGT